MFSFFRRRPAMIPTNGPWYAILTEVSDRGEHRLWREPVVAWMQSSTHPDSLVGVIRDGETLAPHAIDYDNGDTVALIGYAPLDQVAHLPLRSNEFELDASIWADIVASRRELPERPSTAAAELERQPVPA